MEILHEAEEPRTWIEARLFEAFPRCPASLLANSISADSSDAELTLFGCEPAGFGRVVREQKEAEDSYERGHTPFNDK